MTVSERNDDRIQIVGIVGSLRKNGYTKKVVELALEGAKELGADVQLIDLRNYQLVFPFQVDDLPDDVIRLRKQVKAAHGLILGTPEYHGSFSGIIKNAIDLMGFEEFESKMIGLVGVGGGSLGAINALNGLRAIGRQLHAWVIPDQASVANVSKVFVEGEIQDESLANRILDVGRKVAKFTFLHTSKNIEEFMNAWEHAPQNPGGSL